MKTRGLLFTLFISFILALFSVDAQAQREYPGSLLLFPIFETSPGNIYIFTITNVGPEDLVVRLVWVDEEECSPEDQWIRLTKNDTFTFMPSAVNPEIERGFMYAYVVDEINSVYEIDMDYLIGQEFVLQVERFTDFMINAIAFEALYVEPDGKLHLDGVEFNSAPKTVHFPRFFGQPEPGQGSPFFRSKVIFINLTGGKFFNHHTNITIANDNEEIFSQTFAFPCFIYADLTDVSGAFMNSFLLGTGHDKNEPLGFSNVVETGWFLAQGDYAYNPNAVYAIDNASLYAVLIENICTGTLVGASLPFIETDADYNTGMLWSTHPEGQ